MSDTFRLQGTFQSIPILGSPSAQPRVESPISETAQLTNRELGQYTLTSDSAQVVSLGGLSEANVIIIKAVGGKIRVRLTSADGSQQAIPVDSFLALISLTEPYTAIDITRTPATETIVSTFLGQYG